MLSGRLARAALAATILTVTAPARADEPAGSGPAAKSDGSTTRTVGIVLTASGIALCGVGTYFVIRGNANDEDSAKAPAIVSYVVGGSAVLVGVPMWIFGGPSGDAHQARRELTLAMGHRRVEIRGSF
jgi:hypothetical protein